MPGMGELVVISVILAGFGLWIWMLVDCVQHEPPEGGARLGWILAIIFTSWLGAIVYLFARKLRRGRG